MASKLLSSIPFPGIRVNKKGVYITDKKGNIEFISLRMGIEEKIQDIDNGEIKAKIYYESITGQINYIYMNRGEYLNPDALKKYQSKGLDIMPSNVHTLIKHFRNEEVNAQTKFTHSRIGFGRYKEKKIYKLYKSIGINSEYQGSLSIKPRGSKDIYMNCIYKQVLGTATLELALAMGLSAILIAYIGKNKGIDTQIWHLKGQSTTGKTTCMKLALSCFGSTSLQDNGLLTTYNSTKNAMFKKLEGLNGVPIGFDEISTSKTKDFTDFIYVLANGQQKQRLDKESNIKETIGWHGIVLSTGEMSLLSNSNKNAGIQIRCVEVDNITWTKDAKSAEIINQVVSENYGFLAMDMAQHILDKCLDEIEEVFTNAILEVEELFMSNKLQDHFTERRKKNYAIILATALLLQEVLKKELQLEEIKKIFLTIEKESIKQRNFNRSAVDYIKQVVSQESNHFEVNGQQPKVDYWGTIKNKQDYTEVAFLENIFERIIKEGGFQDPKIVLKELKTSEMLDCEKDRLTRVRKTSLGISAKFNVVKIPNKK